MRIRPYAILTLILAAMPAAALEATAPFDPHDPASLVAAADARVKEGDLRTAGILLARAARIAPEDARVARARARLDAARAGMPLPPDPAPAPPRASSAAGREAPRLPPEPPAIWPAR